jgi:hypothetical protein
MRNPLLLATILVVFATTCVAHDIPKGPNGGQVVEDADHHVELTMKEGSVVLFLTDAGDKPLSSVRATGRVIIQDGASQTTTDLVPADPNVMTAKVTAPPKSGTKLVVAIKLGDGHDVKARFVTK